MDLASDGFAQVAVLPGTPPLCGVRLEVDAIDWTGALADGTPLRITPERPFALAFEAQDSGIADDAAAIIVFDRAVLLAGIAPEELPIVDGSARLDGEANDGAIERFLDGVAASATLYRDVDRDGEPGGDDEVVAGGVRFDDDDDDDHDDHDDEKDGKFEDEDGEESESEEGDE